jgi:hypothetical protein
MNFDTIICAVTDMKTTVARNRSEKAGQVLADALINKAQGERPVTLIGYSLGARVIYSCLKSLAERQAFGLVESVVLIGSPIPSNASNWRVMRSVVSGKVINVYSENDYILAFLYRATSIQFGVAGLQEVANVEAVDNLNLTKEVSGHLRYPELIGKILKRCGFDGIKVEDTDIEEEKLSEIQLVDVEEEGWKVDADVKPLSQSAIASLIDAEPVEMGSGQRDGATEITQTIATVNVRDNDSESDDGGILMVDNDSDGELTEIPSVPEGDIGARQETDSRDSDKVPVREEQKSLGSFPKMKKVTASSMGLY